MADPKALIKEARKVLASHMDVCGTCTMLVLCDEAQPLEDEIQRLAAAHLMNEVAARAVRPGPRCECGLAATVRLRYAVVRGLRAGTTVTSDPKCNRCADRAAFAALTFSTAHVSATRLKEAS